MGYQVEQLEPGLVVASFFGSSNADERLGALEEVNALRASGESVVVLVDMSKADMRLYSALHALSMSEAVSRRRRPFTKVAYVLRPDQSDMVATTMSGLYGPELFRRFDNREAAFAWLREPTGPFSDEV